MYDVILDPILEGVVPISVILADDSQPVRNAIVSLLGSQPEIELIGAVDSFAEMLRLVGEHRPNLVLLDLHMKDVRAMVLSNFKASLNGVPILAMSVWTDPETKALAESLGAVQLLDKASLGVELVPAIRKHAKADGPVSGD
jgi:DNA-binding NarL/FixJ family response regulator